jgi:hypothetical protein
VGHKRRAAGDQLYPYYAAISSYSGTLAIRLNRQPFAPAYFRAVSARKRQAGG